MYARVGSFYKELLEVIQFASGSTDGATVTSFNHYANNRIFEVLTGTSRYKIGTFFSFSLLLLLLQYVSCIYETLFAN